MSALDLDALERMALGVLRDEVLALIAIARAAKAWRDATDLDIETRDAYLDACDREDDVTDIGNTADIAQCAMEAAESDLRDALRAAGLVS